MACANSKPESFEIIPEEGGIDSTDANSCDMVNGLLLLFDPLKKLDKELDNTKKEIENKIRIKLQEHKCWSEDDIKQAWKETMDIKTDRKKQWAYVTVLEVVRRFDCKSCKKNAAQKNHDATKEPEEVSEDTSSQRSDEEKAGAAGGKKRNHRQKGSASQGQTGTPCQFMKNFVESDPGNEVQSGKDGSEASETETEVKRRKDKTIYIRIPLSKIIGNKVNSTEIATPFYSTYKLIDSPPKKSKQETDEKTRIQKNGFYVMLFNENKNHAEWVYEILNKKTVPLHYKTPAFKEDRKDPDFQDPNERNPDYDRGHLAAAANHRWCEKAFEATYWMSNITQQNTNLNRGAWRQLEIYCRDKILSKNVRNVHVYTGPLYLKKSDEENLCMLHSSEKDSPTHYFKVLIVENKDGTVNEVECFYIPNDKEQKFKLVKIEEIERLSGLMFKEESSSLTEDKKEMTWKGNKGETSITIDVSISSYKKNEE